MECIGIDAFTTKLVRQKRLFFPPIYLVYVARVLTKTEQDTVLGCLIILKCFWLDLCPNGVNLTECINDIVFLPKGKQILTCCRSFVSIFRNADLL